MLNASKGPAVRGPRAQMDRQLYKQEMQRLLAAVPGLEIVDGAVTNVLLSGSRQNNSVGGRGQVDKAIAGVMLASGELALLIRMQYLIQYDRPCPDIVVAWCCCACMHA